VGARIPNQRIVSRTGLAPRIPIVPRRSASCASGRKKYGSEITPIATNAAVAAPAARAKKRARPGAGRRSSIDPHAAPTTASIAAMWYELRPPSAMARKTTVARAPLGRARRRDSAQARSGRKRFRYWRICTLAGTRSGPSANKRPPIQAGTNAAPISSRKSCAAKAASGYDAKAARFAARSALRSPRRSARRRSGW
jgi:hypothetical protein